MASSLASLKPANPGTPGKMAVKTERERQRERERERERERMCVCVGEVQRRGVYQQILRLVLWHWTLGDDQVHAERRAHWLVSALSTTCHCHWVRRWHSRWPTLGPYIHHTTYLLTYRLTYLPTYLRVVDNPNCNYCQGALSRWVRSVCSLQTRNLGKAILIYKWFSMFNSRRFREFH